MSSTTPSIIHQMRTKLGRWRRNLQAAQLVQQGRALASKGDHTQALTAFKRAFDAQRAVQAQGGNHPV